MITRRTLAQIRAELRVLPTTNPGWPSDALLLLCAACREAASHCEAGGQHQAAGALHDIAQEAQALAPIFAPALDQRAEQLARTEIAIRHGDPA